MKETSTVWFRKVVAIGVVLAAANAVLAGLGRALPEPVVYPFREVQLAVDFLDDQTSSGCTDLLVTGNSMAGWALSGQGLADGLGLRTGVVSFVPASIAVVDIDWAERVTLPRADPGTLVYVPSPITFLPEELAGDQGLTIYERAVEMRGGWPGDLHRWLVDHVPLFHYRLSVADIEGWVGELRGTRPTDLRDPGVAIGGPALAPDGHVRSPRVWTGSEQLLDRVRAAFDSLGVDALPVDPDQWHALRSFLEAMVDEGRDVVVVIPPVSDDLPPVLPGGAAAYERYVAAARSLGEGNGVAVVDRSRARYPDELFVDTHHLNARGAERLTGEVIAALDGRPARPCGT